FLDRLLESPLEDLVAGAVLDGGRPRHISERIRVGIDIKVKFLAHTVGKWLVVCVGDEQVLVGSQFGLAFGGELFPQSWEFVGAWFRAVKPFRVVLISETLSGADL